MDATRAQASGICHLRSKRAEQEPGYCNQDPNQQLFFHPYPTYQFVINSANAFP
jgi:hypothetical protein